MSLDEKTTEDLSRQNAALLGALRESEERFRAAFETDAVGMVLTSPDHRMLRANPTFCRIVGYSENELTGKRFDEITHPDDLAANVAGLARVFNGEVPSFRMEKRYIHKDGRIVWVDMSAASVLDAHHVPLYIVTYVQDITDRKISEQALTQSETMFRSLFENSMDAIILSTPDGNILSANPAACEMFGYTEEELQRIGRAGVIDPDDPRHVDAIEERYRSGRLKGEFSYLRKNGSRLTAEVTSVVLPGGKSFVIGRDVTERKHAEEALRRSEEQYRYLVQNANSAILRWGRDGALTFFNEYAQTFFGWSADEIIGKPVNILLPEKESTGRNLVAMMQDMTDHPERYLSNVNENVRRDGSRVWMAWANHPVLDDNGNLVEVLAIGTDITELKRIEAQLKDLNQNLEERIQERTRKLEETVLQLQTLAQQLTQAEEQERGRLAEILHDDIQQLLVASKMLMGRVGMIYRSDHRLMKLVDHAADLLDQAVQKTRSLSHELSPPMFNQHGIVDALRWLGEQMKSKYDVDVRVVAGAKIDVSNPIKIFLFRAAKEILFNVVKHAQTNQAEMEINRVDRTVRLIISDRGRGFDASRIGPPMGKGFGLFSIRERVGLLGGTLTIDSAPGQGSRFILEVPMDVPGILYKEGTKGT